MSAVVRRRLGAVVVATCAIAGQAAGPAGAEVLAGAAPGARPAPGADTGPTARDVARGRERVRAQAVRVGRINAELAQADGLLGDLGDQAESAVERYNAERVKLDQAKAAYKAAARRSAQARRRLAQVRDDVARMAVGAHHGQGGPPPVAIASGGAGGRAASGGAGGSTASGGAGGRAASGGAGGPAGSGTRATAQGPADRRRALLQREAAAQTAADVSELQAREALAAQEEAVRSAADARQAAVEAVTRQQEAVQRIQQRKAALIAELEAARTSVAALEEARTAALDQARVAGVGPERTVSSHQVVPTGTSPQQGVPAGTSLHAGVPGEASSHQVVPTGTSPRQAALAGSSLPQEVPGGTSPRQIMPAGASSHQVALAGTRLGAGDRALVRGLARGSDLGSVAATAALKWLGTPYSWGGGNETGPTRGIAQGAGTVGFDCSGLVTYAWGKAGVRLVHYATAQYNAGPHPSRGELRPGDLVFFAHNPADPSTIHHVGIYIGNGQMVEAPFTGARVRISPAFRPDYAGATRPVAAPLLSDRAAPRA
ncbi:NlpC/P60 family protein [Actinoallomurus soli]|uniref:NlpC/P60 family protein n=1 Tax=Actinoallomurus soli TaxID=2952535 RepID=UPI0020922ADD|nr:NlpC/P60 family protein [Actinoallomurus soli]MCO5968184.1 NlpC/P60 family protein [Actinoallomurus soli]